MFNTTVANVGKVLRELKANGWTINRNRWTRNRRQFYFTAEPPNVKDSA